MNNTMDSETAEETPLEKSPNIGGVSFFGCKWRVASDDFVLPALLEAFLRFGVLVVVIILFVAEHTEPYIQHYGINGYFIGYGIICFLISLTVTFMGLNSMQGYIWDERPNIRAFVVPLLYVNTVFIVTEMFWLCYGTYIIHRAWNNADDIMGSETVMTLLTTTLSVVIISWIGYFTKLFLTLIFFKKVKRGHTLARNFHRHFSTASTFRIVGDSLGFFFHDPDFVPTDTAAALYLLSLYRKKFSEPEELTEDIPRDYNYVDIEHYMKFSSAIYGFFHLPMLHQMGGFMKIMCKGCCFCCFKERLAIETEGPLGSTCNMFAILYCLPFLTLDSFIYLSFHNELSVTPYMVVRDKERKKIVIAIRGSMTFSDFCTDLLMTSTPIDSYENFYTHKGIMDAARNIYHELRDKKIIVKALEMNPGYSIIVTGHSLGGAVAVILTFLLRITIKSTFCYAYSAPLCLNESARVASEEFVVMVVHGDDVFARISPKNFALLVNQMRHVLRHCKVPKYKILGLKMFSCLLPKRVLSLDDTFLLQSDDEEHMLPQKMLNNKYNRKHSTMMDLTLIVPGKILHIKKGQNDYCVKEINHSYFNQIIISPNMTFDHLPVRMLPAVEAVRRRNEAENKNTSKN